MSGKVGAHGQVAASSMRVYVDRIGKLIPTQLTGAYVAVQAYLGVPDVPKDNIPILVGVAAVFTAMVPAYLILLRGIPWRGYSNIARIIVSMISLPIWATNISINYFVVWLADYVDIELHPNWTKIPVIVLVCWALVTPLLLGKEQKEK